ncbi:MAG: alpha/beta hydrolase [Candidatus Sumerlaeaceae bacterium]|nr:alpha/beta hydrolase [Candidatus Sumerlaeaceae bacterium]
MKLAVRTHKGQAAPGAPPIVFLHAFPTQSAMWDSQLSGLSGLADLHAVDFRGYGKTNAPEGEPFSFGAYADDVRETLEHLGVNKAVLCGCSMGGYTMFEIWRRNPATVAGMILCDTRAEADTPEGRAKRTAQVEQIRMEGGAFMADATVQNLLCDLTRATRPQVVAKVRQWALNTPDSVYIRTLEALANRTDFTATLSTITVPTLVLVGAEDQVTPLASAQIITEGIPGSKLEIIPDAGHLSPLENPEPVNAAIRMFLRSRVNS